MFSDDVLEKIFLHPELQNVPIAYQSSVIHAIEEILKEIKEDNPYVSLSELLSANTNVPK